MLSSWIKLGGVKLDVVYLLFCHLLMLYARFLFF